ncbi:hypothetical protein [Marispirochaeta sp.]|uniref:hypothetical protein n=1 Tax=Marispirochaeta sp. TaxID=2038653 RepID=UPI002D1E41E9|nr:hypothetical protein [Marispirochaeta sp.]
MQNLKAAIEQRLQRLLEQNPLRTDFQRHYEEIVEEYNREKDRVTIEKTFEDLFHFVNDMDEEESRAMREGLYEESTRAAVRLLIHDYLWSDDTGLPVESYSEEEVESVSDEVYRHIYRAYPTVPSPYYKSA